MAIEKGIVVEESKPQNVNGEAIEIEIVNPESGGIETEDGGKLRLLVDNVRFE